MFTNPSLQILGVSGIYKRVQFAKGKIDMSFRTTVLNKICVVRICNI